LKRTVPVRPAHGGEVVWMGTGCAAKACGVGVREYHAEVARLELSAREAESSVLRAEQARWEAWVLARVGKPLVDALDEIRALGGVTALRKAYRLEVGQ